MATADLKDVNPDEPNLELGLPPVDEFEETSIRGTVLDSVIDSVLGSEARSKSPHPEELSHQVKNIETRVDGVDCVGQGAIDASQAEYFSNRLLLPVHPFNKRAVHVGPPLVQQLHGVSDFRHPCQIQVGKKNLLAVARAPFQRRAPRVDHDAMPVRLVRGVRISSGRRTHDERLRVERCA